jgi:hypothetical protein
MFIQITVLCGLLTIIAMFIQVTVFCGLGAITAYPFRLLSYFVV